LRNFDVWVNPDGSINGLVPVFDTGDSLFASEPESEILRACEAGNNYVHSKPYMNPHLAQMDMLHKKSSPPALNPVTRADIMNIINSCFVGKRAVYLYRYVTGNVERLGLLK